MPRNTSGLKRTAGPGRPKGLPNKATREIKEFGEKLFKSKEYRESITKRIIEGKAQPVEIHLMNLTFGKPKEQVEISDLREVPEAVSFIFRKAPGAENKT
jgi:hypothetical protein